jgi:phosphonate transport system permease protein
MRFPGSLKNPHLIEPIPPDPPAIKPPIVAVFQVLENTSKRPVEGVVASCGSRLHAIYYGIMPQVLPVHLSIILYNFESNVRSSTILGIVGAGGIGFMLSDRIAGLFWDQVWTIIFLIIAMVYIVDYLSGLIRTRLIGKVDLAK